VERSRVAIIIPALNEAATIGAVVARIASYGQPIVVDDGSTDATASLARAAGAVVVTHAANQGYDAALNSGFARADQLDCVYLITIDADGQHNPDQLLMIISHLDAGYQLVLGVRQRFQRTAEWVFALCASRLWSMSDPLCGMKGYTRDLYRRAGRFDALRSIGTELAVRSRLEGARTVEMSVQIRERADTPRFGNRLSANYRILRALVALMVNYGLPSRRG